MELNALNKQLVPFEGTSFSNSVSVNLHTTEGEAEEVSDMNDKVRHVNDVHEPIDIIIDSNSTTTTTETDLLGSPNVIGIPTDGVPHCSEHLKPSIGKTFATLDEGLDFYKEYAKICGFSARLDSSKINKGVVTHKQCVCSKQGESKHEGVKRKRAVTRVGCEAKVNFRRLGTGEYEIYEFVEHHKHPMVTPDTMIHLKSSRNLNLVHKKIIMDNSRINQGPVKSFRMFKEYVRGYKNVGASLEDFKKISRDVKKYIKEYDAQMLIETFMQKKAICPSFYFDFEVDKDQNLNKNFWADPIGIKNYALFGDSNSFDTTFDFNKYRMVFTPFTGVDNHKRCVTFAAGLIAKENAKSFSWLFENYLKAMGGCYPITLITDQCRGIKAGVEKVFSGITEHRYCMWHIMKKMPEKVGSTISRDTDFLKEITAMDAQRWKHSKLTADSRNSSPILSTPLKLERQASEFYTPNVFYEFQEELKKACFQCGLEKIVSKETAENISVADREKKKVYEVVSSENKFMCSCKIFERFGVLCRHIMWVLKDKGFEEIPPDYLLSRWSKNASCRPIFNVSGTLLLADCASIDTRQHKISELWSEVFKSVSLVEDDEDNTEGLLSILQSFNEKIMITRSANKSQRNKTEIEILIGSKIPDEAIILPPKQSKNKGSGRRMMSDKEKSIQEHQRPLRKCNACGQMANHDKRNCHKKVKTII
ncbi:hypothetical protein RND81_11G028600 [Saponaria officinalis]|uniref:SWIM-type domain-containing protein n=1 Tax=Saponaria officinalis TaxID=3572 RepID=A0AAW1HHD4_SAPOF